MVGARLHEGPLHGLPHVTISYARRVTTLFNVTSLVMQCGALNLRGSEHFATLPASPCVARRGWEVM